MKPPYTRAQIQAASPKRPAPASAYTRNHYLAFDALTAILTGDKPTLQHWVELANVANILEALRQQRVVVDPKGLIADCLQTLRIMRGRSALRLDAAGRENMILMLESYVCFCKEIPDRMLKSAVNYAFNAQQHQRNL